MIFQCLFRTGFLRPLGQQWCLEPWQWPILPRRFPKSWGYPQLSSNFHRIFIGFSTIKSINHPAIEDTPVYYRKPPNLQRFSHLQRRCFHLPIGFRPRKPHVSWPRQGLRGLPLCAPTFCRSSCARRCSSNVGRRTSSNVQNHSSVEQNWSQWP